MLKTTYFKLFVFVLKERETEKEGEKESEWERTLRTNIYNPRDATINAGFISMQIILSGCKYHYNRSCLQSASRFMLIIYLDM